MMVLFSTAIVATLDTTDAGMDGVGIGTRNALESEVRHGASVIAEGCGTMEICHRQTTTACNIFLLID